MKWPFVRRSKFYALIDDLCFENAKCRELGYENQSLSEEINRLNQELASELNSHRDIKKELEETKDALKIAQEDTRQHKMSLDLADEKEEKIKQYLIKVINYI